MQYFLFLNYFGTKPWFSTGGKTPVHKPLILQRSKRSLGQPTAGRPNSLPAEENCFGREKEYLCKDETR